MILYIVGPVTGLENNNRPAFEYAKIALESVGYDACIPHDGIPSDASHEDAMRTSLGNIVESLESGPYIEGLATLCGWMDSKGACLEAAVAQSIGIPVKSVGKWIEEGGSL